MHQAQAFIAMPFDQKFYIVYQAIKAACESLKIKVIRIDEVWARDDIYQQIEEEILNSDFMIADFTGDRLFDVANPNVVHEAAFARTKKKYIILMAQDHKCLPFDWRTRPAIIYQATPEGLTYLQERLVIGIRALMEKEDFGRDSEMEKANAMPYQMPSFMPQSNMGHMMPMQMQTQAQYSPSFELSSNVNEIESILINKAGQKVITDTGYNARLPKGFTEKNNTITCRTDSSEMIHVPATTFAMGHGKEEETMEHNVSISEYLIDKFPVTNKQFELFILAGGYQFQGFWSDAAWQWLHANKISLPAYWNNEKFNSKNQPVVGISWYEAMAYAAWVGKHLPTEAQWELAARGTDKREYPWGDQTPSSKIANYRSVANKTTPVDKYGDYPSFYGCIDMAGNTWEWCYDWYEENYYENSLQENPIGPQASSDNEKVCRGGAWTYDIETLKVYQRYFGVITLRDKSSGFRCARIL